MAVEITPEPDGVEREAIRAALAAEALERPVASQWAAALLPAHDEEEP